MNTREPIIVWAFEDAPPNLRKLSRNGGDEDWLVELPPKYAAAGYLPLWIERLDTCLTPQRIAHPDMDGWEVIIGSHA